MNHLSFAIQAALNTDDPQYQDKRLAAQRNGKLSVQFFRVRVIACYQSICNNFGKLYNTPSIQVHVGKERDAILDMLPYLRLGYVSDPSEMQSVLSSQGPICPVCLCCYSSFTVYETEHIILDGCGASNC